MTAMGVYRPGTSVLHRLPAGVKLVALAVTIVALSIWSTTPTRLVAVAAVVLAVFAAGRIGPRVAVAQLRPVLLVVVLIFAFQLVFTDWRRAVVVSVVLLASVALAIAVTLTTRTIDMLAALTSLLRPLSAIGLRTEQLALALALTVRSIPLMVELVRQVEEARHARGLPLRAATAVTPLVIAALRTADGFGETLVARGLD